MKARLHRLERAVVVEMLGVDVRDDRDRRRELEERAVALVGFGDEILAAAETRAGADRLQAAADEDRGIEPALGEHERGEPRRRRLAVRARDGDPLLHAHELREHFRARNHRHALVAREVHLGIVGGDRGRHDDDVGVARVIAAVVVVDLRAELREAIRHVGPLRIGSRDLESEIDEELGDPAHAGAADSHEMNSSHAPEHPGLHSLDHQDLADVFQAPPLSRSLLATRRRRGRRRPAARALATPRPSRGGDPHPARAS